MTGLEKVTGKIIADAEADARVILEKAQAECEAIKERYAAETEAEIEKLTDECDRECQALIIQSHPSLNEHLDYCSLPLVDAAKKIQISLE